MLGKRKPFKKICVIGTGVMGQAIAAHMANAKLECLLLDVAKDGPSRDQLSKDAIKKILGSKPSLLFSKSDIDLIKTGNIEDDLAKVKDCDLVIEAIIENIDAKQALFKKLQPLIGRNTIVASNTSGLSIEKMLHGLSADFAERFLVMHFFNPVRYLHLLEVVPSKNTRPDIVSLIKSFGEKRLGKGVIIAKDTPNFVANRIGVYGMMATMHAVLNDGYSIEEVDTVFGANLGRPKSAVFRTADVVGLDTFIHVAKNCYDNLAHDECHDIFKIPDFLSKMVAQGLLGQKSGQGFYKKVKEEIFAIDPKTLSYQPKAKVRFESIGMIKNQANLCDKIRSMFNSNDRGAQLFFDLTAKTCIYAANRIPEIADDIASIDNALKWGFGWEMGPFEMWDAMGVKESVHRMKEHGLVVPEWVTTMLKSGRNSFYAKSDKGAVNVYSPLSKDINELSKDEREWNIQLLKSNPTNIVLDTQSYSLIDSQKGALIIEFHSKMNAIDPEILQGINLAIDRCENGEFAALVIANEGMNFSVGANILLLYMAASQGLWQEIEKMVRLFQQTGQRLRYSSIPTVAAPFQLTLGGGCELSMWCDRIHAQAETYIGLVEVGVGLIPGGGGNIEMLDRTLRGAIDSPTFVSEHMIQRALETVAMAKVATSAVEGREMLFLRPEDSFSMNNQYLLHDAVVTAMSLAKSGYIPPKKREFRLPGKNGYATFDMGLRAFLGGGFASDHDYKIAMKVAHVMTGGNTNSYQKISEDAVLDLEREAFLSLCGEEKTQARIAYMLEHNKPLRN